MCLNVPGTSSGSSISQGAESAFEDLMGYSKSQLPAAVLDHSQNVTFWKTTTSGDKVCFPCPLREQEAAAALKALEGCAAAAIRDHQVRQKANKDGHHANSRTTTSRAIKVSLERVTCFLMSSYLTQLDGMGKYHPEIRSRLPDTDLNQAQSITYRRLSANLYETRIPGEYYHIHGSLDATTTLGMLGLPPFDPDLTDYRQCINKIELAVKQYSRGELEHRNNRFRQAGVPVLTAQEFQSTPHGRALSCLPPFTVEPLERDSPPVSFDNSGTSGVLSGVRVLELCRIIAGPVIGRSLAAHGADVLKVTSPELPDVPFFQLDVNAGKHTTSLHLKDPRDRAIFDELLSTADVIIDGYRPGALARLGYSPEALSRLAVERGRGIVYVSEDCFGGTSVPGAEWAARPGWQQIADCVSGVAWEQGRFMGLSEPVVPPFPMSDYGTGCLGTIAALTGLLNRATLGGSWICRTSLTKYNMFLLALGRYDDTTLREIRHRHDPDFWQLRHSDSVDEVSRRALKSMRRAFPDILDGIMGCSTPDRQKNPRSHRHNHLDDMATATSPLPKPGTLWHRRFSKAFGGVVTWPRDPLEVEGTRIGVVRTTRPNGYDAPTWDDWEVDEQLLKDIGGAVEGKEKMESPDGGKGREKW